MKITKISVKIEGYYFDYKINNNEGKITCNDIFNADKKYIEAVLKGFEAVKNVIKNSNTEYCETKF